MNNCFYKINGEYQCLNIEYFDTNMTDISLVPIIIGINNSNKIYYADNDVKNNPNWKQLSNKFINVTYSNKLSFCIDIDSNIYYSSYNILYKNFFSDWTKIQSLNNINLIQIFLDGYNHILVCIDNLKNIYYEDRNIFNPKWTKLNYQLNNLCLSNKQIFGIDTSNNIMYYPDYTDSKNSMRIYSEEKIKHICYDPFKKILIKIDLFGNIYYALDKTKNNFWTIKSPRWINISGNIKNIIYASYSNKQIYALDKFGKIYYNSNYKSSNWINIYGQLSQICFEEN